MSEDLKYLCRVAKLYEEKLAELMTKKDYEIFMRDVSRVVRREMITEMPDSGFKEFLLALEKSWMKRRRND